MKKKAIFLITFLVLFLASFFSCSTQEVKPIEIEQLLGHWHLIDTERSTEYGLNQYYTVDFLEDSTINFSSGLREDIPAYFIKSKNQIRVIGDFGGPFEYSIDGDLLTITSETDNGYHGNYIAQRCEGNCCDRQKEYFDILKIGIDLPVLSQDNCIAQGSRSLEIDFFVGFNQNQPKGLNTYHLGLVIDESFSEENLELFINNSLQSINKSYHKKAYALIHADKKVKIKKISPIVNQSKKLGIGAYLALRGEDYSKGLKVCMKEIDFEKWNDSLNQDLTVEEWLNEN